MKKILSVLLAFAFILGSSSSVVAAGESVGDRGRSWSVPNDGELGQFVQ